MAVGAIETKAPRLYGRYTISTLGLWLFPNIRGFNCVSFHIIEGNVFAIWEEQHQRDCNLAIRAFDSRHLVYPFIMRNYNFSLSMDSRTSQHPSAESEILTISVEIVLALHRSSRARTDCLYGLAPKDSCRKRI